MGYVHFTEEQKQRAGSVDLVDFLRSNGEKLISAGREWRLSSDHSITVRGNTWYDHAEEKAAARLALSNMFTEKLSGRSYHAAEWGTGGGIQTKPERRKTKAPFVLPPPNSNMRRVYAYLLKTGFGSEDCGCICKKRSDL